MCLGLLGSVLPSTQKDFNNEEYKKYFSLLQQAYQKERLACPYTDYPESIVTNYHQQEIYFDHGPTQIIFLNTPLKPSSTLLTYLVFEIIDRMITSQCWQWKCNRQQSHPLPQSTLHRNPTVLSPSTSSLFPGKTPENALVSLAIPTHLASYILSPVVNVFFLIAAKKDRCYALINTLLNSLPSHHLLQSLRTSLFKTNQVLSQQFQIRNLLI
jgi:hypothetical protein